MSNFPKEIQKVTFQETGKFGRMAIDKRMYFIWRGIL